MVAGADLDISSLREQLCAVGQAHLLDGWVSLSLEEQRSLKVQLEVRVADLSCCCAIRASAQLLFA